MPVGNNLTNMAKHNDFGKWGEEVAAEYLVKNGYFIRERNWRLGHRDVDIIAMTADGRTVVFFEVKTREGDEVMNPTEAVDSKKIKSIGFCANSYIKNFNLDTEIRFDIITIVGTPTSEIKIKHFEEAFNPCLL